LSKHDEIRQLFSCFETEDFSCPQKKRGWCHVRENEEASFPPFLGDENTDVMVVAQSPSTSKGVGHHAIQLFSEVTASKGSRIDKLRDFIKEHYNTVPHFTDLAKCGVVGRDEATLSERIDICTERFLFDEMDILKPKTVICVGNRSQEFFKKLRKDQFHGLPDQLVFLTHYSNQAQLPLSIDDKYDIVWKWQAGFLKDISRELPKLSYFSESLPD